MLWRSMATQRRELGAAGVLGAIASVSAVALLGTSAWLIATASQMPPVLTLTVAAVMVRALALSRAVFRYGERLVGHDAAFRGLAELRVVVYRSLERLAPTGLAAFARGDLLSRLVDDVDAALDLPLRVVLPWLQAVLVALGTVAFLVWLLPPAGWAVGLLSAVALAAVPWLVAWTARAADARMAPARGAMSAAVVQAIDATPEITAYGAGAAVTSVVEGLDADLTRLGARESLSLGLGGGLGVLVQGAAVTAALVLAVPAVGSGRIEPVWLAVIALLPLALSDVFSGLPAAALAYQRLRGSATRLVDVQETASPRDEPVELPVAFGGLRLEGVSARWVASQADDGPDIRGVWLTVNPGERVAVVGPSGSGKSTLAAVIMGFLPYEGSATISGIDIRDVAGDAIRAQVGMLAQLAHVFDTTIADNVRIGDPDASEESVAVALEQAQLTDWVSRLPDGLRTRVGSFGVAISGGERQRLALARLLLAQRPLVILDEPTEHLDGPTADALARTLATALSDATVLLITHRLTGMEAFDRIVEMQDGRIVAQGGHDDMVSRDGWYARQWRLERDRQDMAILLPTLPVGRAVRGPLG